MWPIWGHATGQGMGFGLSALNRVYMFRQVYPKQGKVARLLLLDMVFSKQGPRIEVFVCH